MECKPIVVCCVYMIRYPASIPSYRFCLGYNSSTGMYLLAVGGVRVGNGVSGVDVGIDTGL